MKVRVKEVNPLKQGLKQKKKIRDEEGFLVKEVNPLKQGLKRSLNLHFGSLISC